jgi:hypothetical protein
VEVAMAQFVVRNIENAVKVDRFENGVNLLVFQVIDGSLSRAFKRNAEDALGQLEMLRITHASA